MNTRIISTRAEVADGNDGKIVVLYIPVVEVKFQFVGVAKVILHHHDEIMRLITRRRVVQAEFFRSPAGSGR